MTSCLVVLSGGQDSATCLFWARQNFDTVHAITFGYGQRHSVEIDAARKVAQLAGVASHEVIVLSAEHAGSSVRDKSFSGVPAPILMGSSPLVSDAQLEQYADADSLPGGLEKTFVPLRNMLFLTIAANRAYELGSSNLVTGVCQEDYGGYPDCRRAFIDAMERACNEGAFTGAADTRPRLRIHTPLMFLTKAETCLLATRLGGCYDALAWTHTAYDGQYPPTGKDHANLLREKGFREAGLPDPLVLRAVREGLMDMPDSDNYSDDALSQIEAGWEN